MYHLLPVRARVLSVSLSGVKVKLTADVGWSGGGLSDSELRLAVVTVSLRGSPLSSSHLLPINLRKSFKNPLLCPEFGGWGQRGRERICRDKPCSGKKTLLPKIKIWEVSWELRLGENTLRKAVAFTRHFTAGHLNASQFRFPFLSNESPGLTRQLAPRNQNCSLSTLTSKYIAQNWLGVDEESNSLNKTSYPFIGGSWSPWLFSTLRSTPTSPGAAWRPLPFSLWV